MPLSGAVLGPLIDVAANVANPVALAPSLPNWLAIATAWMAHVQTASVTSSFVCPPTGTPLTGFGRITGMSGTVLGAALAAAATTGNPTGLASSIPIWTDVADAFVAYTQGAAMLLPGALIAPPPIAPAPATAGGPLTGLGLISALDGTAMGDAMAAAAAQGNADALAAITSSWRSIGVLVAAHMMTLGQVGPGTLVATAGGGPVIIGTGVLL